MYKHKDLLQKLWNEYSYVIDTIDEAMSLDEPWQILDRCITDTPRMKQLRKELIEVGIKLSDDPYWKYESGGGSIIK